jgi:hypothetical protein
VCKHNEPTTELVVLPSPGLNGLFSDLVVVEQNLDDFEDPRLMSCFQLSVESHTPKIVFRQGADGLLSNLECSRSCGRSLAQDSFLKLLFLLSPCKVVPSVTKDLSG